MRTFELLNKLTLGNKLFVAGLAIGLSATTHAQELTTGQHILSDVQHQANRCDSSTANWRTEQKDFALACAEAGLGGISSCERKLEKCSSSKRTPSYCIGDATSRADHRENQQTARDERRELQDRKDQLMQDFRDKQNQILEAKEAQDAIQQNIQQTLADNENAKVQEQLKLELALQQTTEAIAKTKDQIAQTELELSSMVVENEIKCRETALAEKNRYIRMVRGRKMTINQIFGRTGLSINQSGSIRYERVLSNCKALYTSTGKRTGFGSEYLLRRRNIQLQRNILSRQIDVFERNKERAKRNTTLAIANLDQQKAAALVRFQNENARATERVQVLQAQGNQMLAEYRKLDGEVNILGRTISSSQISAIAGIAEQTLAGRLTGKMSSSGEKEKIARQDKIDAFNKALGLKDLIDNAEEDKKEVCGEQEEAAVIAAAAEAQESIIDLSGSLEDTTTATATPVIGSPRTPAAAPITAGETR